MLSRSWKMELVDRSTAIHKILEKEGIQHSLVGIGGQAIQFSFYTSQSVDNLIQILFRTWSNVVGVQITKPCDNRVISVIFDVPEYDANAPVGNEDDDSGENLEAGHR